MLESEQETLLSRLFALNDSLNEETKEEELKKHPALYNSLQYKMCKFGALNRNRLRASQERWTKKARVHRNRRKQEF
ncbi:MAG: hypothetical protein LVR00_07595 [Rhabdochlamydiaceae bacterium]|jgi:hypothetical protein